jgi:hypothetical protein
MPKPSVEDDGLTVFMSGCTTVAAPSNSRAHAATLSLVASLRFNRRSLMTC